MPNRAKTAAILLLLIFGAACASPTEPSASFLGSAVRFAGTITRRGVPVDSARVLVIGKRIHPCGFWLCDSPGYEDQGPGIPSYFTNPVYSDAKGGYSFRYETRDVGVCDSMTLLIQLLLPDRTVDFEQPLGRCGEQIVDHDFE